MNQSIKMIRPALVSLIVMTILCGIIYTGIVTGIAQAIFPGQANGSVITVRLPGGAVKDVGSALIGQEFTKPEYLIGRPMGTTNLNPGSTEEADKVKERIDMWHSIDPGNKAEIPADLVYASGSGVDPNISPKAAEYQAARIARERNISKEEVMNVIHECTRGRFLGFWGEPSVNVLKVNLMLDGLQPIQ